MAKPMSERLKNWLSFVSAEWVFALLLGTCVIGWWTTKTELKELTSCTHPVLNHQPLQEEQISTPFPLEELKPGDESTLWNITDFEFFTPVSCDREFLIVVVVVSAPHHLLLRRAIRETWGTSFKLVFLIGVSDIWMPQVAKEQSMYGDLVIGKFVDDYNSLPFKHIMALKWIVYRCPTTRYILKVDDDVVVNPAALLEFILNRLSPFGSRNLLLCKVFKGEQRTVHRNRRSKFVLSQAEYRDDYFPTYCAGAAVMFSPDVVFKLYSEVQRRTVPYFRFEDVFITGLVAARINVSHSEMGYFMKDCDYHDRDYIIKRRFSMICLFSNLRGPILKVLWNSSLTTPFVSALPVSNPS